MAPVRGALVASLLCFALSAGFFAAQARSADPSPDDVLDEAIARKVLEKVLPTPTPWGRGDSVFVSSLGNVVMVGRPTGVFVKGQAPVNVVPQRCRAEFAKVPDGTSLACFPDDDLARRINGE